MKLWKERVFVVVVVVMVVDLAFVVVCVCDDVHFHGTGSCL